MSENYISIQVKGGGGGGRRGLKSDIVCFCLQVDEPNRAAY